MIDNTELSTLQSRTTRLYNLMKAEGTDAAKALQWAQGAALHLYVRTSKVVSMALLGFELQPLTLREVLAITQDQQNTKTQESEPNRQARRDYQNQMRRMFKKLKKLQ